MSYANVMLYGSVLPDYSSDLNGRKKGTMGTGKADVIIDADDPRNRDIYLKFIHGQ